MLSLTKAASQVNASKSTIQRAIKSGKLSAKKTDAGYQIDPAELFRVFPKNGVHEEVMRRSGPPMEDGARKQIETLVELAVLKAELEASKAANGVLERQSAELKQDRDEWREQAKQQSQVTQRLLEDKRPGRSAPNMLLGFFGRYRRPKLK